MSTDLQTIENMFKWNTGIFDRTIREIPTEQWLTQPSDSSNHLLWVVGHVVVTRAVALKLLGGEWSAPWQELFKRGGQRVEAEKYPPAAEVREAWEDVSQKLLARLPQAAPEFLSKPVEKGKPSIDGTIGGTVGFLCLHESYHLGQLGFLRKWLGHGRALG